MCYVVWPSFLSKVGKKNSVSKGGKGLCLFWGFDHLRGRKFLAIIRSTRFDCLLEFMRYIGGGDGLHFLGAGAY